MWKWIKLLFVCFSSISFQIPIFYLFSVESGSFFSFSLPPAKNKTQNERKIYFFVENFRNKTGGRIKFEEWKPSFYDYNNCKPFECQKENRECFFWKKSAKNDKFEKRENYPIRSKGSLCESFLFLFIFIISFLYFFFCVFVFFCWSRYLLPLWAPKELCMRMPCIYVQCPIYVQRKKRETCMLKHNLLTVKGNLHG